jgi:hypothetical protein
MRHTLDPLFHFKNKNNLKKAVTASYVANLLLLMDEKIQC